MVIGTQVRGQMSLAQDVVAGEELRLGVGRVRQRFLESCQNSGYV
jgi:hypothetical protein